MMRSRVLLVAALVVACAIPSLADVRVFGAGQGVLVGDRGVTTSPALGDVVVASSISATAEPPSSADDFVSWGRALSALPAQAPAPVSTSIAINGESIPDYDLAVIDGPHTVSSFDAATYFTTTEDSRPAVVVIKGDFTVAAAQTFTPSVRKTFTYVYVDGNCDIDGDISMSRRGANHSASGSDLVAVDLRILTGTLSAVVNPQIPAAGGAGAAGVENGDGSTGGAGVAGGLGGGGSGGGVGEGTSSGAGAAGTSYSGGSATGGQRFGDGANAEDRGGAGGDGFASNNRPAGGGAGNPGGTGVNGTGTGEPGGNGTGGGLVVVCDGVLSGDGSATSNGAPGGGVVTTLGTAVPGAGSGGGSVTVIAASGTLTTTANGGAGGAITGGGTGSLGGAGGLGSARVLTGSF
jgi:hypothetical protein